MNVAMTGATGFFGRVLLRLLLGEADTVRTLVKRTRDADRMRAAGAVPILGDLTNPDGCNNLVQPDDIVFHSAARVDTTGRWSDFRKTTIDGTRNLLRAALPAKPARFVYVSSGAVYPPTAHGRPVCADNTSAGPPRYNRYGRSKLQAERIVQQQCEQACCPWVIVRLGFLYGPRQHTLLERVHMLLKRDRLFIIGKGDNRIATCYVDDAAEAVRLAGVHPNAQNRIYDVANDEYVTQRQLFNAIADMLGQPHTRRNVRHSIGHVAGFLADLAGYVPGSKPPFGRATIALLGTDQIMDASKIKNELGWQPKLNFEKGMQATTTWYQQHKKNA